MVKKKLATALMLSSFATLAVASDFANDLLQGDERSACEAILCLSSNARPNECAPSIHRYFSIKHKKLGDTLRARRDFLNMCPAKNEQGMPELIDAIANGAGRCDAKELNRMMRYPSWGKICEQKTYRARNGRTYTVEENCREGMKFKVRPDKPQYCKSYHDHGWTNVSDSVRYVGEENNGGRWVDVRQ